MAVANVPIAPFCSCKIITNNLDRWQNLVCTHKSIPYYHDDECCHVAQQHVLRCTGFVRIRISTNRGLLNKRGLYTSGGEVNVKVKSRFLRLKIISWSGRMLEWRLVKTGEMQLKGDALEGCSGKKYCDRTAVLNQTSWFEERRI